MSNINPQFPVFLLSGVLVSEESYNALMGEFDYIKNFFWKNKNVVFHSRDIRKCEKEFVLLFDLAVKAKFYEMINSSVANNKYTIIAAAINKQKFILNYGKLSNDVYEISLSFIIERSVFYLDGLTDKCSSLDVVIEKRGPKEDKKLEEHFQRLCSRGTYFVNGKRLRDYNFNITFNGKRDNIAGLQLADLVAYPIANFVIDPTRANPSFDVLKGKIYSKHGKRYGLKIFP